MNSVNSLAVFTPKGGTGKTTTAHSVACALARSGERTLLLDLDSQANLSYWFGVSRPTLWDVIEGRRTLPAAVQSTDVEGLDIIAADSLLAGAEGMLRARRGGELWLKQQLRTLPSSRWRWIVFDCPPGLGILTVAALTAARFAVSPAPPNVLDSAGVGQVLAHVEEIRTSGLNPDIELLGVVPVRVDGRLRVTREMLAQMRELLGARVFGTEVPQDVRVIEAPSYRRSIFDHAPGSRATLAYEQLTEEIRERVSRSR